MTANRSKVFPLGHSWPAMLADLGIEPRALLRRAELPDDLLARPNASLETSDYFRLWGALETEAGPGDAPIRIVEMLRAEMFHPVLFAALCSSDMATAVHRVALYKRLVAPMELHVTEDARGLQLELSFIDRTVVPPRSLAAFELLFFTQLARMGTRERVVPRAVETPRPPEPSDPYEAYLGCPITRGEAHRVTFSLVDARKPFLTANEAMWQAFEPELRRRLADLDASATFAERVRAVLLEALPGGESSMDDVSSRLGVSKRTLQRRLRDEHTTFQSVLNRTREDLARHYLSRTKLSGAEISYLLGFEDPNSFFRAFHAWTGHTTEEVRLSQA